MHKRLIPLLLMDKDQRLVKTLAFNERTYIGDPFNVMRLFNEREVDEICLLDIDASSNQRKPNFEFLAKLASECFMPLAYGGGISSLEDCKILNRMGIEKFVLKHHALDEDLLRDLVNEFGSQALIGCIDYTGEGMAARTASRFSNNMSPLDLARRYQSLGFGEIILQSVERDGARKGYDLETVAIIANAVNIPVIALGGAGELTHFRPVLEVGASAAASGSAFSFIGRLRAVLVNYPEPTMLSRITGGFS